MTRVIVIALVTLAVLGGFGAWGLAEFGLWRYRRRIDRRQIVLDDEIQQNARDNYRLLIRSVRAMQQVLDADAVMPSLSADLRRELLAVVSEFNQEALPKGTQ